MEKRKEENWGERRREGEEKRRTEGRSACACVSVHSMSVCVQMHANVGVHVWERL